MNPIRVFLVDDTATVRHILTGILESEPDIQVVATAGDGEQALQRLRHLQLDVMVLDVEMPGMSGLDVLREIRRTRPQLPVIIFSSLTERGAAVTVEALSLGAVDYVTKPGMTGSPEEARKWIRAKLVTRIHALMQPNERHLDNPARQTIPSTTPSREPSPTPRQGRSERVDVVVIGVSMGGPRALTRLFERLPGNLPVPVLIVQHMPPLFISALARRLSETGGLSVVECDRPVLVSPGCAWLASGGYHMKLIKKPGGVQVQPTLDEPVNFCRPSVDVLFRDAAAIFGAHVLAVVMTGMGHDGLDGADVIRSAGGRTIVQGRESSVVWGMGGSIVAANLADAEVPLNALADEICRRVHRERPWWNPPAPESVSIEHPENCQ